MPAYEYLRGIYAAAVTPLRADGTPDLSALPELLHFLARQGCHGALLLGTTGEGPSFSPRERQAILRAGQEFQREQPDFRLLVGTGTPSLDETISLTKMAFELGYRAVVVLPPYYYKGVADEGLFQWFSQVIQQAVPGDGHLLGYHIPGVSGVGLSLDLLARLHDRYPRQLAGIKDSSGEAENVRQFARRFGGELISLVGNDRLLSLALENGLAGCITAMANLQATNLRNVWEAFQSDTTAPAIQKTLDAARALMDRHAPFPPLVKALLHQMYQMPPWAVRPPLLPVDEETAQRVATEMQALTND